MSSRIHPKGADTKGRSPHRKGRCSEMYNRLNTPWWRETIRYHTYNEVDIIAPIIAKGNRFDRVTGWF